MTTALKRAALVAAAMAGLGMGGAEIIPREYGGAPSPHWTPARRMGNNRPEGPTRAQKKRRRKIQRASRRYNLRHGF